MVHLLAKLYSKSTAGPVGQISPEILLPAVEVFISTCRSPAVLEWGAPVIPLEKGHYAIEIRGERLWIEACTESNSLSRRILTVESQTPGTLNCTVHRFGGKPGKLSIFDLDRPRNAQMSLAGARRNFGEQFRVMLSRQFPGWEISTLSAGMDLQRSFSPVFPRARLVRGTSEIAAISCPSADAEPALLAFALIWFDYLRSRLPQGHRISLALFLPDGSGCFSAQRLRWLRNELLAARLFRFNSDGLAGEVDKEDLGNLDTRLSPQPAFHRPGLAKYDSQAANFTRSHPPERSFELSVRQNIGILGPTLLSHPVYSQVLTFAGGDRDLIDLLAVSLDGRLTVLELKMSEDIHLPLQALDYWMRVKCHAERSELRGLFPFTPLRGESPKLILAAPAMSFHSTNATVLRYFSPEIEVERIGVTSDWQRQFKVTMRLKGADDPISHGSLNGNTGIGQHPEGSYQP